MKALECTVNVTGHGQVDGVLVIIPGKGVAAVTGGIPILGDLVVLLESSEEMRGIIAIGVVDGKVIHDQGKLHIPSVMAPEARSEWTGVITMKWEQALEVVISEASGLWEAIHAFPDFHIDMAIVDKVMEIVMVHDCVGNGGDVDVHVSIISGWHGCAEVKIFKITDQASRAWCGDDAIEKEFCSDDIGSFGADVTTVFDPIAAHSPLDAVWVGFFRPVCTNNAQICGMFAFWDNRERDEKHGVGPRNGVSALG